jgi:hypothetical protein
MPDDSKLMIFQRISFLRFWDSVVFILVLFEKSQLPRGGIRLPGMEIRPAKRREERSVPDESPVGEY